MRGFLIFRQMTRRMTVTYSDWLSLRNVRLSSLRHGVILTAALCLLMLLTPPSHADATTDITSPDCIINTSFETGSEAEPDGWNIWGKGAHIRDNTTAASGRWSVRIGPSGWETGWMSEVCDLPAHREQYLWVKATVKAKAHRSTGRTYLSIVWFDDTKWLGNTDSVYAPAGTWGWQTVQTAGIAPPTAARFQIVLRCDNNMGRVWFDDVAVQFESLPRRAVATGRIPGDASAYSAFATEYPDHPLTPMAHWQVALALEGAEITDEALRHINQLAEMQNTPIPRLKVLQKKIDLLTALGQTREAMAICEDMARHPLPEIAVTGLHRKGELLEKQRAFSQAVSVYESIRNVSPEAEALGMYLAGKVLVSRVQHQEAIPYLERAFELISLDSEHAGLFNNLIDALAFAYHNTARTEHALGLILDYQKENPDYTPPAGLLRLMGGVKEKAGDLAGADEAHSLIIQTSTSPDDIALALCNKAIQLYMRFEYKAALEPLEEALAQDPSPDLLARVLCWKGLVYRETGNRQAGDRFLAQAFEANPESYWGKFASERLQEEDSPEEQ